jgi:hypothetical protein
MRKTSETRPETLVPSQYGGYEFNWNVTETEGGYAYDSVDVAGELTRANIKYAMMRERYTGEEITQYENAHHDNPQSTDLGVMAYLAVKTWIEAVILQELGPEE